MINKIDIIRTEIRDLFRQNIRTAEFAEELLKPEAYQDYTRILSDTMDVLRYITRIKLATTRATLIRSGDVR